MGKGGSRVGDIVFSLWGGEEGEGEREREVLWVCELLLRVAD